MHAARRNSIAASPAILLALALGNGCGLLRAVTTHISCAYGLGLAAASGATHLGRGSRLLGRILHVQILSYSIEVANLAVAGRHGEFGVRLRTAHAQVAH